MKITSLQIDSYRQMENLLLDFTYPKGHEKFGQPLQKICLIGQSATGKTSILELIKNSIGKFNEAEILNGKYFLRHFNLDFQGKIELVYDDMFKTDNHLIITNNKVKKNDVEFENFSAGGGGGTVGRIMTEGLKILYISAEIISKELIHLFNQNPITLNESSEAKDPKFRSKYNPTNFVYEFGQDLNTGLWLSLLYDILDYRKRFTELASQLINKGLIGDSDRLGREYQNWAKENKNPLLQFSAYFDTVLEKLNLEIDPVSTEYTIPIRQKVTQTVIPVTGLSTGTKSLLLTSYLLYSMDTSDSIILLDEPERSLFPDLQVELMTYYSQLIPKAQLITATHSPLIAASFEPEERFILYFDQKGKVAVRRGTAPIGDDPNDLLTDDFRVDYYNSYGKQAYKQYIDLKRKLLNEKETSKKTEILLELTELGDKYNF